MLGIAHLWRVPQHMFNEPGEGGVRSRSGSFNEMFYESREGKRGRFSYLESLKMSERRLQGVLFS